MTKMVGCKRELGFDKRNDMQPHNSLELKFGSKGWTGGGVRMVVRMV